MIICAPDPATLHSCVEPNHPAPAMVKQNTSVNRRLLRAMPPTAAHVGSHRGDADGDLGPWPDNWVESWMTANRGLAIAVAIG